MKPWQVQISARVGDFQLDVALDGHQEPLAIIGANGAGKTTLLKAIAGLASSSAGEVSLGEQLWQNESSAVPPERRQVGWLPQGAPLMPHLTVAQSVAFGRGVTEERAAIWLHRFELNDLAHHSTQALSGGQRQRVALAQVLATEPKWLLLDEPFAALDAPGRLQVYEHLREVKAPLWFTSHDLREVAALGARVAVLERGALASHSTLQELIDAPPTSLVAAMVRELKLPTL